MKKSIVCNSILTVFLSCCLAGNLFSQADAGEDKYLCKNSTSGVVIGGNGDPSWCYSWTPPDGLSDSHTLHPTAKPTSTTTYTLKAVGPNFSSTSTDDVVVTVIEVTITPASQSVTESLNSNDYTVTVTPNTVTPTYEWTWKAPSGAGNNPNVIFSNANGQTTKVNTTRWFASPNNRHALITGTSSTYEINCKTTVESQVCTVNAPVQLTVTVNSNPGNTSWPQFAGANTIQVSTRAVGGNTEWYVSGIGSFRRVPPSLTMNLPATSQFYAKFSAHEAKHVTQWNSENPWQNLFHANNLYNNTLKNLTSTVSEADLRNKIAIAVLNKQQADGQTATNTKCAREIGAWQVTRAVAPNYLELDDSEVPSVYGCTP